jgi:outer membrane protein assembly factor BamC
MRNWAIAIAVGAAVSVLAGCGITDRMERNRTEYKSAAKLPPLDVPPDLTRPGRDDRYAVPDTPSGPPGTATFSTYSADRAVAARAPSNDVLPVSERVRLERVGRERFLVVSDSPDKLWPVVREFWQENGFLLRVDSPDVGVMETDWAENRARIPNDGIRSILGRVLDTAYSTGERDKYRTRLERSGDGKSTEIYISHRGMVETIVNSARGQEGTIWQPRAADPELEAEFLQKLMTRLGTEAERAKAQLAAQTGAPERAKLADGADGGGSLVLDEPFDRAWRRVGLALDRVGFTVEDRDRSKGFYFVRYADPKDDVPMQRPGLLTRIFGIGGENRTVSAEQFRVLVRSSADESSQVQVLNKEGGVDSSPTAKRILGLLHAQLK